MTHVLMLSDPPPSVNAMYRNVSGRGRVRTKAYKAWAKVAWAELQQQALPKFSGQVSVTIQLPQKMRGDVDNRAKATLDLLQACGVVANDRQCDPVHIGRANVDCTTIIISEAFE